MVSCADSRKPLATLGDSDGQDCRDHDGNSFPTSALPAMASEMGGPHLIDCLLRPLSRDACSGVCSPPPGVPPEVLPLGIKTPVIPLFVLLLDVMVAIPAWKDSRMTPINAI